MAYMTVLDVQERLLDYLGESSAGVSVRVIRRAIIEALHELGACHQWSAYYAPLRIVTSASYSTGTIAYDDTGGTYERMVTLTTGTWPTWAAHGLLIIDSVAYGVAERISDTVILLEALSNPGADVTAGETYRLVRQHYELPSDLKGIGDLTLVPANLVLEPVSAVSFHQRYGRSMTNVGQPWCYAVYGAEDGLGTVGLYFYPNPDSAYTVDGVYQRHPRLPSTWEYATGTVTVTSGSTTVTLSGGTWTSRMEGAVIRISDTAADLPTDLGGVHPYEYEGRIVAVISPGTSARVDVAPTVSHTTGVKYRISDPVDVEGAMATAFMRTAEKQLAEGRRLPKWEQAVQAWRLAVRSAAAADRRDLTPSVAIPGGTLVRTPERRWPQGSDA